jgi:nuclear receptor interaction protein
MPHSNDRTVITCAGDSEVRVFDLEYGGNAGSATDSSFQNSTRSLRFNKFFSNARWLNETTTSARVYRSHADRVKRVVTESSPHLFLTCSEDGEVRQWDLRQPSSFYPAPSRTRRWGRYYHSATDDNASGSVPPPLISYKKYALDLNSISCSASQPQYIALGGAHLHCFLHDRRMLGRDLDAERGKPASYKPPVAGSTEDEAMNQATRCVRRFAPNNKRKMKLHDNGHITACKISDARPNEVIASWSGEHIYSFDIVNSPDVRDKEAQMEAKYVAKRLRHQSERKRKRMENASSSSSAGKAQPPQRLRRVADGTQEDGQTALRVQYEDGESSVTLTDLRSRHALLIESKARAESVAHALVRLRKTMFEFTASFGDAAEMEHPTELTPHTAIYTNILGQCTALLPQMDEIIRGWTYPVNPSDEDVRFQNTMRKNRQKSWRFVQATGVLARSLGGIVQTTGGLDVSQVHFGTIKPANREERHIDDSERFCYDFLKAITLWISGGRGRLFAGFRRHADTDAMTQRYPLDQHEGRMEILHRQLSQYLQDLADETTPIVDLDANEFLTDNQRNLFENQKRAVTDFMHAVERTVLATNGEAHSIAELETMQTDNLEKQSQARIMDKGVAARCWAVPVGRSLLMAAAEGVNYDFVRRAFGGVGVMSEDMVDAVRDPASSSAPRTEEPGTSLTVQIEGATDEDDNEFHDATETTAHAEAASNSSDASDSSASDSEDAPLPIPQHVAFTRRHSRTSVNASIPYRSHNRCYRGHLNARTVKDVNYYGLDDEYIVSGSDDGHFFIWDRKTGEVVNILKGDGEVVNVVTGHPIEPMLAVSGIDSTVKIFGVGGRERRDARAGVNIANPGGSVHSSLRFGGRLRMQNFDTEEDDDDDDDGDSVLDTDAQAADPDQAIAGAGVNYDSDEDNDSSRNIAPNGLASRKAMHRNYEIMNQNDAARREDGGGEGDFLMAIEGMGGGADMQLLFARAWMLATMQQGV